MNKDEATAFIISELGKQHSRNDIIMALCERMKINWQEAEQLVREVESQNSRAIATRQAPILLILGIGIIIAGLVVMYSSADYFINYYYFKSQYIANQKMAQGAIYGLVLGPSMFIGGLVGTWKALSNLRK
jgi:cytochrome b561